MELANLLSFVVTCDTTSLAKAINFASDQTATEALLFSVNFLLRMLADVIGFDMSFLSKGAITSSGSTSASASALLESTVGASCAFKFSSQLRLFWSTARGAGIS